MTRQYGMVTKGWGSEEIWASNDRYCGKLMHFRSGSRFSCHFHAEKDETWYVLSGKFTVMVINTADATQNSYDLGPGDTWHNPPLVPHQLICHEAGTIIEISTPDSVEDNHRVMPGDSQR